MSAAGDFTAFLHRAVFVGKAALVSWERKVPPQGSEEQVWDGTNVRFEVSQQTTRQLSQFYATQLLR